MNYSKQVELFYFWAKFKFKITTLDLLTFLNLRLINNAINFVESLIVNFNQIGWLGMVHYV